MSNGQEVSHFSLTIHFLKASSVRSQSRAYSASPQPSLNGRLPERNARASIKFGNLEKIHRRRRLLSFYFFYYCRALLESDPFQRPFLGVESSAPAAPHSVTAYAGRSSSSCGEVGRSVSLNN